MEEHPLALKRFKNWLPHVANLHKKARAMAADAFKEENPNMAKRFGTIN
jgi:hypothetical protein